MPFFESDELAETRADMTAELGPMTLTIVVQREGESPTGGPDIALQTLTGPGGQPLEIPYRSRALRTPRTKTEGEQSVVVADWEIKLPWEFTARIKSGDLLYAACGHYTVHLMDTRPDALLCRLEVLKKEATR